MNLIELLFFVLAVFISVLLARLFPLCWLVGVLPAIVVGFGSVFSFLKILEKILPGPRHLNKKD